jgi:hypothetical protein
MADEAKPDATPKPGSYDSIGQIEGILGAEADQGRRGFDWVKSMPVALSIAGLVLYGVITVADERFYGALGITSGDIGLSYTNTLVRASGLVIIFGVVVAALGLVVAAPRVTPTLSLSDLFQGATEQEPERFRVRLLATRLKLREMQSYRNAQRRRTYFLSGAFVVLLLLIVLPTLYHIAAQRADLVRSGHSVGPVRLLGLTILPISADPATVQWVSLPDDRDDLPALPQHLLFLGQAGGMTPLYNPAKGQVLWLPSNSISVRVSH